MHGHPLAGVTSPSSSAPITTKQHSAVSWRHGYRSVLSQTWESIPKQVACTSQVSSLLSQPSLHSWFQVEQHLSPLTKHGGIMRLIIRDDKVTAAQYMEALKQSRRKRRQLGSSTVVEGGHAVRVPLPSFPLGAPAGRCEIRRTMYGVPPPTHHPWPTLQGPAVTTMYYTVLLA